MNRQERHEIESMLKRMLSYLGRDNVAIQVDAGASFVPTGGKREFNYFKFDSVGSHTFYSWDESYHNGDSYNNFNTAVSEFPENLLESLHHRLYADCVKQARDAVMGTLILGALAPLGITPPKEK